MELFSSFMLSLSGGIVVVSILMSKIGYDRAALSRKAAAMMSGLGVGIGCGIFTYYGVSNGDFIGSIITGIIAAFSVGFANYISYKLFDRK